MKPDQDTYPDGSIIFINDLVLSYYKGYYEISIGHKRILINPELNITVREIGSRTSEDSQE